MELIPPRLESIFLRHFARSQSKELRAAAQNWLALLVNKELHCVASR